jgi:hypothetical protein
VADYRVGREHFADSGSVIGHSETAPKTFPSDTKSSASAGWLGRWGLSVPMRSRLFSMNDFAFKICRPRRRCHRGLAWLGSGPNQGGVIGKKSGLQSPVLLSLARVGY